MSSIHDLDKLLVFFAPNSEFLGAKYHKLTSSGDNYGSVLLAVDISINKDDKHEEIHAVAKKLPSNQLVQKMFNSRCTFPNEVGFYQTIAPCLCDFRKLHGVPPLTSYPEFYAARDKDPVLLIKNIKHEGFRILDRTVGFDFEQARIVLTKMAELHATVLALRMLNVGVFKEKLVPFFGEYETFVMDEDSNEKMITVALDVVKHDEFCCRYLPQLTNIMRATSLIIPKKNDRAIKENPFFTLVHSDLWTNNIMVKTGDQQTEIKFVDYQLYEFTSLTRDVVFFVFSSVQTDVLQQKCDDLLRHYHSNFIDSLNEFKCDLDGLSYEDFLEDMKIMVQKYEFFHIMTMLPPIYTKDTKDVEMLEMDSFIFYGSQVTDAHKEKACFIVRDFVRRGWLV